MPPAGWAGLGMLLLIVAGVMVVRRDQGQAVAEETGELVSGKSAVLSETTSGDGQASQTGDGLAVIIDEEAFFLPTTPGSVRQRIWEDVVDGENWRKLDFALRVIESPDFGWHLPARQLLVLYLGEDPGDDYRLWRSRVIQKWDSQQVDKNAIVERLRVHRTRHHQQP